MDKPRVEILGIYSLTVSDELVDEQLAILYDPDELRENKKLARECRQQVQRQLESAVLFEVMVHNPDRHFSVDDFTQPNKKLPRDNWQAPWSEAYLNIPGDSLLPGQNQSSRKPPNQARICFFLHGFDPSVPLRTSYGDIACPKPQPMPQRLAELVPYEPVD